MEWGITSPRTSGTTWICRSCKDSPRAFQTSMDLPYLTISFPVLELKGATFLCLLLWQMKICSLATKATTWWGTCQDCPSCLAEMASNGSQVPDTNPLPHYILGTARRDWVAWLGLWLFPFHLSLYIFISYTLSIVYLYEYFIHYAH